MPKPRPKKQPPRGRHTDTFTISGGALGPVPACELSIRPFTVFVGAQGTGKSLVAQTLYGFEELPFLMGNASAERGAFFPIERMIISQLRSAMSAGYLALPITFRLFTHWMNDHAAPAVDHWSRGEPDTPQGKIIERLGRKPLEGRLGSTAISGNGNSDRAKVAVSSIWTWHPPGSEPTGRFLTSPVPCSPFAVQEISPRS